MPLNKKIAKTIEKKISKKQKKRLQKVLERRKRKKDVSELLDELKQHQLSDEEYALLTPKFGSQRKGFKRVQVDDDDSNNKHETSAAKIYSSGKKFRPSNGLSYSPSVHTLLLDASSSDDDDDDDDDKQNVEQVNALVEQIPPQLNLSSSSEASTTDANSAVSSCLKSQPKLVETHSKSNNQDTQKVASIKQISNVTAALPANSQYVYVNRPPDVEKARKELPIISEEFSIIEHIKDNPAVILCGETGSGKTTQIPQFLYEHGYAREKQIVITQPRRVAAIAMSKRVAFEMGLSTELVSYQIRYEGNCSDKTRIKFVTDGVLLKEIQKDFLLSSYSVVIIDEAHERSIYSDILIGLLSRIIRLREKRGQSLKLLVMSATLRISDFTENAKLFKQQLPVIKIESRQYEVKVHFSKHTPLDYIKEAFKKVCKIHQDMPDGAILVFLTGRKEVNLLISKLKRRFIAKHQSKAAIFSSRTDSRNGQEEKQMKQEKDEAENKQESDNEFDEQLCTRRKKSRPSQQKSRNLRRSGTILESAKTLQDLMLPVNLDNIDDCLADSELSSDSEDEHLDSEESDDGDVYDALNEQEAFNKPLYCLPLYSMLPEKEQAKVFEKPPEGTRLCVVATNVAETSLTIPNVKYVVDTGKIKNKFYDKYTGISAHLVEWCAKSSADQRAGRAGRTTNGHCYRLYSSAVYNNDFKDFPDAEILKKPLDDLILQLKSMHIELIQNFPFPTAPDLTNVEATEKRLLLLGALENRLSNEKLVSANRELAYTRVISSLGKIIAVFPVSPRYGKMLAVALQQGLIDHMIVIVACLTVQEIFIHDTGNKASKDGEVSNKNNADLTDEKEMQKQQQRSDSFWESVKAMRHKWLGSGNSLYLGDITLMMRAVQACEANNNRFAFCEKIGVQHKSMIEIHKLRKQIIKEVSTSFPKYSVCTDLKKVPEPSDEQFKKLRQLMLLGFCDHIARIPPPAENLSAEDKRKYKDSYRSVEIESPVFINERSALHEHKPEWLVYQEIYENRKLYMRNVVAIEQAWISVYAANMCKFSKPLEKPEPYYDSSNDQVKCAVVATFGPYSWVLQKSAEIEYPDCADKYKLFTRYLLEGKVLPVLEKYTRHYLSSPSMLTKDWGTVREECRAILAPILNNKIATRRKLEKHLQSNSNFLLKEYQRWLPQSMHSEIAHTWHQYIRSNKLSI